MRTTRTLLAAFLVISAFGATANAAAEQQVIQGEQLDPASYGPSVIESMAEVLARDLYQPRPLSKGRRGSPGVWKVPTLASSGVAASGSHYIINQWGDTRMGIGFRQPVNVNGAFFLGQGGEGVWTTGIQIIGYLNGREVQRTDWFRKLSSEPKWFAMNLEHVDRIVIVAEPVVQGGGWYGLDDLTYVPVGAQDTDTARKVVHFDDLSYRQVLTGSDYADLIWEAGAGEFNDRLVPAPQTAEIPRTAGGPPAQPSGTRAMTPQLVMSFQGVLRGDAGSESAPPDTDGAIGPDHYVETVNRNFAVYDKSNGTELMNVLLGSFLPGSNGDPRVVFDQHSQRWIVIVSDFSATASIYLAVSLTDDPMGDWFKTSFATDGGSDSGCWPDYPTLGVDSQGIYTASYMVGCGMTIFAIHKQPLVTSPPSLGTITAFRGLPFEGAIQPAHTYGTLTPEYCISLDSSTALRLRRINGPLSNPTMTDLGTVTVPYYSAPPDAPALGSSTPLDTVGDRLMMSVYRAGSLWTAHTIDVNGRAGCRWYEISPTTLSVIQSGTVADSSLYYFFPSIMVNQHGDAVMGFTGSNSSQYAACYYTGRSESDPAGEMAEPVMYKEGTGPHNIIDGYGRNRWGDYSYTTLDPSDQTTFWTVQEYGHDTDVWGTYVAVLQVAPPDCNNNGVPDDEDIAAGTSEDCNSNGVPDECEVPPLGDNDCNGNGIPDDCDIAEATSEDCNANGTPDECEVPPLGNFDCNGNGIPDDCDIAEATSSDCNNNELPDECDIAGGTSQDCQPNGIPDECEIGTTDLELLFDMNSNPNWTMQGQWEWGQPTGGGGDHGGPDPTSGYTGDNVVGYNLNGDYAANLPETHLTAGPFDFSGLSNVHVSFWRWLGVEQPTYDHAYFRVSTNGTTWTTLWENTAEVADYSWQYQNYDISAYADDQPTVYLRWTMGETDYAWQYCGWNIDDVLITGEGEGGGEGDCNANQIPDECDIAAGASEDCNANNVPDECDIASGASEDANGNGIPDECEGAAECRGDCNCDGQVDFQDIMFFVAALNGYDAWVDYHLAHLGTPPTCPWSNCDANGVGGVAFDDIMPFVDLIGQPCQR